MKILVLLSLLVGMPAFALNGPITSGGGDDVALEFAQAFDKAFNEIKANDPDLYNQIAAANLPDLLKSAQILVVNQPLKVTYNTLEQESVATNTPASKWIAINRFRWQQIHQAHIREAVALHEVASLAGLESTAHYPISSGYLAKMSLSSDPVVILSGVDPKVDSSLVTTRASCTDDTASMNVKTKQILKAHQESLQTSGDWTVNGKIYSLAYMFQQTKTGSNPLPEFISMVRTQTQQNGGVLVHSTSQALMLTPASGKVEDFTFTGDNFGEVDANGLQNMYEWTNGAKGALITQSTQNTQPDGSVHSVSTDKNPNVYNGWTTAPEGSVETCTTTAMTRETWLIIANDPAMAADMTNLDTLSYAANDAERVYRSCDQSNCPQLYADLAAKEQAFVTAFSGMFTKQKDSLSKQYAAVRARIEAERRAAIAARRTYTPRYGYDSDNSGIAAALEAVREAQIQSHRNQVEQELADIRDELAKRNH